VPQNRLQRDYFLTWWYDKGRASIREADVAADTKWFVRGIPFRLFRKLAVGTLRWIVTFKPSQRFTYRLTVWLLAGMIVESYRHSRQLRHKREKVSSV